MSLHKNSLEMNLLEDKLNNIQKRIDEIDKLLRAHHVESFNWSKTIYDNQQNIKKVMGINDSSMPFEPYYNRSVPLGSSEPKIYNEYGEKLKVFFISDRDWAHEPYHDGRYIFFDRYNYALKNHFYTHDEAFRLVGEPDSRFTLIGEPPSIKPQTYENYLNNKEYIENNFNMVFSHDIRILSAFKNAKFAPAAGIWYGQNSARMADNVTVGGG